MHQQPYVVCILLILTDIILAEVCHPVAFLKFNDVVETNSANSSLVKTHHTETLNDCVKRVTPSPSLLWFLYDKERKECVTGQCWDIQLHHQMTSKQVLYRRVSVPRSCSDVKTASPDAEDGEYWIYPDAPTFLGCPTKIYCHNMTSQSPSEYVTLPMPNGGVYPKQRNSNCDGEGKYEEAAEAGTSDFQKIRVNINDMTVNMQDFTFDVGTGYKHPYGFANDCYSIASKGCGPIGTFDIDTSQTGMIVSLQQMWTKYGWKAHEVSMTRSADGRHIHLLCGGACGGCEPQGGVLQLHRNTKEVLPLASARFATPE